MATTVAAAYSLPMQRDVAAFHDAFGLPNLVGEPSALPLDRIDLRLELLREEGVVELREAADEGDPVEIIDALIDTIYVALGALVEMGRSATDPRAFASTAASSHPTQQRLDVEMLVESARSDALSNEMYLAVLEGAFRRRDADSSAEILDAVTTTAMLTMLNAGIDPLPFFDEIQRANMSKLGADGRPVYSRGMGFDGYPAGKVLKGANYSPPDLNAIYTELYGARVGAAAGFGPGA